MHSVIKQEIHLYQNFRESNFLITSKNATFTKFLYKEVPEKVSVIPIAQCGKIKNLLSPNFFFVKSTRHLVNSLVKLLLSRNFCKKSVRENFPNLHIVFYHTFEIFCEFVIGKADYMKFLSNTGKSKIQ